MKKVFILDVNENPLEPVYIGYARMLLSSGQATVFVRYPFTIILKSEYSSPKLKPLAEGIDSKKFVARLKSDAKRTNFYAGSKNPKLSTYYSR